MPRPTVGVYKCCSTLSTSSKDWFNDTVLALTCEYIQEGMSDVNLTKQTAPVHPGVSMLGPLTSSSVHQAYDTGDYNKNLEMVARAM